jgi:hypothetical protein
MRKIPHILAAGLLTALAVGSVGVAQARGSVSWSVGVGVPGVAVGVGAYPAPVVVAPPYYYGGYYGNYYGYYDYAPPVVYRPAPAYYGRPVYYGSRPYRHVRGRYYR